MKGLRLVTPDIKYQEEYISFVRECADDIKANEMYHHLPL